MLPTTIPANPFTATRRGAEVVALGSVLAVVSVARADELVSCSGIPLVVDESVQPVWYQAVRAACDTIGTHGEVDRSASIHMAQRGEDLVVSVRLPDGRSAERRISRSESVAPTLEALVLLPPQREARAEAPAPVHSENAQAFSPRPVVAAPAAPLGVEVGGGMSGRIAGSVPYGSVGAAGFASFRSGRWLLDLGMRWEIIQRPLRTNVSTLEMRTMAASLAVERRIVDSGPTIDLGAGPSFVFETQTFDVSGEEKGGAESDVRIAAQGRIAGGDAPLRWVLGLDGELAPSRIGRPRRIDETLPPLPAWSAGLLMGVIWTGQ